MTSASPLSPTFYGHIASTQDALLLFEACLSGALNHVARRPHDRERVSLIKSGNVFIYEEHSSGIKRWTDGVPWSPSRILGNFLVYRELERPFPPGEKKRAMKRSKRSPGISKQESFTGLSHGLNGGYTSPNASSTFESPNGNPLSKETERSLIGSLIDSYGFKEEGLVKKTVSVTIGGVSHHLVSYYTVADVMNNKFSTPSKDPRFQHITVRPDLLTKQNFRTPIDEVDSMDRMDDRSYANYPYPRNGYEMTNQTMAHRPMSLPTPPISYGSSSSIYSTYGVSPHSATYEGLPQSAPNSAYGSHFAPSPGMYPAVKQDSYEMGGYRQRYNSVIGIGTDGRMGSDGSRSHLQQPVSSFSRRPSNYESNSVDSGISGMSSTSSESKFPTDTGYASQGYYGAGMREPSTASQSYTPHRALPTPTQQTFDRPPQSAYSSGDNPWSLGSTGSSHGNFIAPQWAGSGNP